MFDRGERRPASGPQLTCLPLSRRTGIGPLAQLDQQGAVEFPAQDRCREQHPSGRRIQAVHAGADHALDRIRKVDAVQGARQHGPPLVVDAQGAVLDQGLAELFQVERVPLGSLVQEPGEAAGEGRRPEHVADDDLGGVGLERSEPDRLVGGGDVPEQVRAGARGHYQEKAIRRRHLRQATQHRGRAVVPPLPVFEKRAPTASVSRRA